MSQEATRPDVILFIYPHLKEFLVLDVRGEQAAQPAMRQVPTDAVFTERFFRELEEAFTELLRQSETPFANLISLPKEMEQLLRQQMAAAILDHLDRDSQTPPPPTLGVLLFTGPALQVDSVQLTRVLKAVVAPKTPPWAVMDCVDMVERLLLEEREQAQQTEEAEAQETVEADPPTLLSLWEARN